VADRSADWLAQAVRDLEQARSSQAEQRHEWACFAAQQSAEKAAKALHLARGQEGWGHELTDKAKVLDNLYVPTRYANGHPEGAPFEHYGPIQSEQAILYAGEILDFVRSQMA